MANVGDKVMILKRESYRYGADWHALMRTAGRNDQVWDAPVGVVCRAFDGNRGYSIELMRDGCRLLCWRCAEDEITIILTKQEQEAKMGTTQVGEIAVGARVRLNPNAPDHDGANMRMWLEQSGGGEGTVVSPHQGYPILWDILWDNGVTNVYRTSALTLVLKAGDVTCPACKQKVKKVKAPPKPVITLDPYQFVRFFPDMCGEWKEIFKRNRWEDAWKTGMDKHGGAAVMCDFLRKKGGKCVCNKGYKAWRAEAERVLDAKLVDYKGLVDRWTRGKKRKSGKK